MDMYISLYKVGSLQKERWYFKFEDATNLDPNKYESGIFEDLQNATEAIAKRIQAVSRTSKEDMGVSLSFKPSHDIECAGRAGFEKIAMLRCLPLSEEEIGRFWEKFENISRLEG